MDLNRRLPHTDPSRFSMVPRSDVPRSKFKTKHSLKTTIRPNYLCPIECTDVLPGDVHRGRVTIFARLAELLFPLMDHVILETFFFFVPNRLVFTNWPKMMGERTNPSDSISYVIPTLDIYEQDPCTLADYFDLPSRGQVNNGQGYPVSALPFRGYNLIYNEWFRDQNLQNALVVDKDDGPDTNTDYVLRKRNKRHDYFTSALPWPLKGGVEVTIPMSGTAPITGIAVNTAVAPTVGNPTPYDDTQGTVASGWPAYYKFSTADLIVARAATTGAGANLQIYADLASATGQTINALRLAFQTQRLLERDARGGTRYTELLRSHFGVTPEDSRLQRPEYIGGGRTSFNTQAIPQTSATGLTGGSRPLGSLGAASTASDQHSFSYHSTEHGYIIGLVNVTGEVSYQQGIRRHWTRQTRYDFYWPAFAHLGEQAIRLDEIYAKATSGLDATVFGYQERWAEYRHRQNVVTGMFRSRATGNIDEWHLAENFGTTPALNSAFIAQNTDFQRVFAAAALAENLSVLFDSVFDIEVTRPLPMYSVPGQIDRF